LRERKKEMSKKFKPTPPRLNWDNANALMLPDGNIDVNVVILSAVPARSLLENYSKASKYVLSLLQREDLWKLLWFREFPDQVADIGHVMVPESDVNRRLVFGTIPRPPKWIQDVPLERTFVERQLGLPAPDPGPLGAEPYVAWRKYWLWTHFFRRTLMRGIVTRMNSLVDRAIRRARRDIAPIFKGGPVSRFTFALVGPNDQEGSQHSDVKITTPSGGVFIWDIWALIPLLDTVNVQDDWTVDFLRRFIPDEDRVGRFTPWGIVGMPIVAARFFLKFYGNTINNTPVLVRVLSILRHSDFSVLMTNQTRDATIQQREQLASVFLNWYILTTFEWRGEESPLTDVLPETEFPRLYHNLRAIVNDHSQANISHVWFQRLQVLLNAPRVRPREMYLPSDKSRVLDPNVFTNKIFLGDKLCANCNKDASHQCKRCKAVTYCGKNCQKTHWKAEHKGICKALSIGILEDYDFNASKPEIEISNWDYEFAAGKYFSHFGKAKALKKLRERFDTAEGKIGAIGEMIYWWWAYKIVSEMPEFKAPRDPPKFKHMGLTYKQWALNAYAETEADPWDTPKSVEVRIGEAIVAIGSKRQELGEGDDMYNFWTWVIRDIRNV
jgi:hypothetical protein